MKKRLLMLLSTSLIFGLVACNAADPSEDSTIKDDSSEEGKKDDKENPGENPDTPKDDTPSEPGEPGEPGEPENQGDTPVDPENPEEPSDPTDPEEPGDTPVDPEDPGEPSDPTDPEEPGDDPADPTDPEEPGDEPGEGDEEQDISVVVNNNSLEDIAVSKDKDLAKPGDAIVLTITSKKMGYIIDTLSITDSEGNALSRTPVADGKFEVALPNNGIINVSATLVGMTLKAYIFDEKSNFSGEIAMADPSGEFVKLTEAKYEQTVLYYEVIYGRTLKMKLVENGYFLPTGVKMGEEIYAIDSEGYVTFKLEKESLKNAFFQITVQYDDKTPISDEGSVHLVVEGSEHITGELYDSSKEKQISSANEYETVYIKITSSSEDYAVKRIYLSYKTSETASSTSTRDVNFDEESGMYKFEVPYTYEGSTVTIYIQETSTVLLRDTAIPGEYFTLMIGGTTTHNFNLTNPNTLKIEDSGKISYNGQQTYVTSIKNEKTLSADNYSDLYYGKNLFLSATNLRSPSSETYQLLSIKKTNASDTVEDFKIHGEAFAINNIRYFVFEIFYKESPYASMYMQYERDDHYVKNLEVYFDTSINYLYGNDFISDKVMYEVKKDETKLAAFTYINDGGLSARSLLEEPFGVYHNEEKSLILVNESSAIYEDVFYILKLEGNNATLANASRKLVMALDTTDHTFTVTSDEEVSNTELPDFAGKMFTGQYYDDWWESYETIDIEFNTYEGDAISGTIYHGGKSSWQPHIFDFEYVSFDFNTNILTVTITSQKYNEGVIGKNIRFLVSDGKIKGLDDLNSIYPLKNIEFACSTFSW